MNDRESTLLQAKDANELERKLQLIKIDELTFAEKQHVRNQLDQVLQNVEVVSTSKMRRRVTRLIAALSLPAGNMNDLQMDSATLVSRFSTAKSSQELEATMNSVIIPPPEDDAGKAALLSALESVLTSNKVELSRKLKRRISRLIYVLNATHVNMNHESHDQVSDKPADVIADAIDVERLCSDLCGAVTAADVERMVMGISTETILKVPERELILQCLHNILSKNLALNSKCRRRVSRLISGITLSIGAPEEIEIVLTTPTIVSPPLSKAVVSQAAKIPHVVFIGQLDFKVDADDIERHLRSGGVEGPIKIRLNRDPKTGISKGTAFVELEGPREMHKCLGLHHTLLKNRRINVEKTCGGRNKELRHQKIKNLREAQKVKSSEDVDAVLTEFSSAAGINPREIEDSVMNRLYACTPSEVKDMMELLKKDSSSSDSSYYRLKKILSDKDNGGCNVDQSRELGYGSFKRLREDIASLDNVNKRHCRPPDEFDGSATRDCHSIERKREIAKVFPSFRGRGGKIVSSRLISSPDIGGR